MHLGEGLSGQIILALGIRRAYLPDGGSRAELHLVFQSIFLRKITYFRVYIPPFIITYLLTYVNCLRVELPQVFLYFYGHGTGKRRLKHSAILSLPLGEGFLIAFALISKTPYVGFPYRCKRNSALRTPHPPLRGPPSPTGEGLI